MSQLTHYFKGLFYVSLFCMIFSCQREINIDKQDLDQANVFQDDMSISPEFQEGKSIICLTDEMADKLGEDWNLNNISTRSSELADVFSSLGVKSVSRVFNMDPRFKKRYYKEGLHKWYTIEYDKSLPVTKASASLEKAPGIESVEPVRNKEFGSIQYNDPQLYRQYWLKNTSGVDINIDKVWEYYTKGRDNVTVAVMDKGVDLNHPDLSANVIPDSEHGSRNFMNIKSHVYPSIHGTLVAGIISAVNNNKIGVSSIAGGDFALGQKGVKIMSCQMLYSEGETNTSGSKGDMDVYRHAADNGTVISQNSWGYTFNSKNPEGYRKQQIEPALKKAIDYYIKYAGCDNDGNKLPDSPMKGGLVIFCAHNHNQPAGPPSHYEPIISVGGVDRNGQKASFSNYGDFVDICAPAVGVYSTIRYSQYQGQDGTSFACPQVSGVASLIVSYYAQRGDLTEALVKEALLQGASRTRARAALSKVGPLLDALGSFTYMDEHYGDFPAQVKEVSQDAWTGKVLSLSWKITSNTQNTKVKAFKYKLLMSKDKSLLENINLLDIPDGVIVKNFNTGNLDIGDKISVDIRDLDIDATYYYRLLALNYLDHYQDSENKIYEFFTKKNEAPIVIKKDDKKIVESVGQSFVLKLSDYVENPDDDELKVVSTNSNFYIQRDGDNLTIRSNNKTGLQKLSLRVSDIIDNTVEFSIDVFVKKSKEGDTKDKSSVVAEVFPTVVKDFLNIRSYSNDKKQTRIDIYSSLGVLIYSITKDMSVFEPEYLNIKTLPSGSYLLKVSYGDKVYTSKVVKI